MITTREDDFFKAQAIFSQMCQFVQQATEEGQRIDQVERGLFSEAMKLCLELLARLFDLD